MLKYGVLGLGNPPFIHVHAFPVFSSKLSDFQNGCFQRQQNSQTSQNGCFQICNLALLLSQDHKVAVVIIVKCGVGAVLFF